MGHIARANSGAGCVAVKDHGIFEGWMSDVAKPDKDEKCEEQFTPQRMWSTNFLAVAGSAPDFPYPEEPLPAEPGPDFDEVS